MTTIPAGFELESSAPSIPAGFELEHSSPSVPAGFELEHSAPAIPHGFELEQPPATTAGIGAAPQSPRDLTPATGMTGVVRSFQKGAFEGTVKTAQGMESLSRFMNPANVGLESSGAVPKAPRLLGPERVNPLLHTIDQAFPTADTKLNTAASIAGKAAPALIAGTVAGPEAAVPIFAGQGASEGAAAAEDAAYNARQQGRQVSPLRENLAVAGGGVIGGATGYAAGHLMEAGGMLANPAERIAAQAIGGIPQSVAGNIQQNTTNQIADPQAKWQDVTPKDVGQSVATNTLFAVGGELHSAVNNRLEAKGEQPAKTPEAPKEIPPHDFPEVPPGFEIEQPSNIIQPGTRWEKPTAPKLPQQADQQQYNPQDLRDALPIRATIPKLPPEVGIRPQYKPRQLLDAMDPTNKVTRQPAGTRTTDIENRLLQIGEQFGANGDDSMASEKLHGEHGAISTANMTFHKELPGEVKSFLEGRFNLKKMFQVTDDPGKAHGADAMAQMGDQYFNRIEQLGQNKLKAAKEAARQSDDPEHQMLAAVHDKIEEFQAYKKPRPASEAVDPSQYKDGTEFTIMGSKIQVLEDADGVKILKDGGDFPVVPADQVGKIPVDKGSAREGELPAAGEFAPPQEAVDAPNVRRKPVHEMSYDELDNQIKVERDYDKNLIKRIFGDKTDEYNRVFRKANSTISPIEEVDAATTRMQEMENALPKHLQDQLFGIGQPERPSIQHLKDVRDAIGGVDDSSPQALGASLGSAITEIGMETDPAKMNERQQVAYVKMREANRIMAERGWDEKPVMESAVRAAGSRFSDPEDAAFMLRRWVKPPADAMRPEQFRDVEELWKQRDQQKTQQAQTASTEKQLPGPKFSDQSTPGIFGQPTIASTGVGEQKPLFHEPVKMEVPREKPVGSKAANEPGNTGEMFPKRGTGEVYGEGRGGKSKASPEETPRKKIVGESPVAKGFIGQDVVPKAVEAAKTVVQAKEDIRRTFAPQTRTDEARIAANVTRESAATLAQRYDRADAALSSAKKFFDKQKPEANLKFIDDVENGRPQTGATEAIAKTMREMLDGRRREVQALGKGKGKLEHFIKDYFPHIWKDPEQASNIFGKIFGKRPLEGPKSFLKKRSIPTVREGIEAGLEPISQNPVEMVLLKVREMDRYILAQRLLQDLKGRGLAKFVRATDMAPEGYAKIDDRVAQVYGPPTIPVSEVVDRVVYEGMTKLADSLGIKHERLFNAGRGKLGYSEQGGNRIVSQFATGERVVAHEIGHQLDYKYGLFDRFFHNPDDKLRPQLKRELRALADLKSASLDEPQGHQTAYTRKRAEQMAHITEAYINNRPQFRDVAPTVLNEFEKVIQAHPELHQIRAIQRSLGKKALSNEVPHGGLLKFGEYQAPEAVAQVLNNYLSPGLRGKGWYRALTGAGNVMNQAQLGMSAFHLGFTSMDAATSKFSLGLWKAVHGRPLEGLADIAKSPAAPFANFFRGDKVLKEWYAPGSQGEQVAAMVDAVRRAGGRVRTDAVYRTDAAQKMMEAFRRGNAVGGVLRLPMAAMDLAAKPIMEYIVPRQKLGVFADMAKAEMTRLGPDAKPDDVHAALAKAWDSADNRMGQVVYDNLFWNKAYKDIAMASVRSLGWNLGTWRELGGGMADFLRAGSKIARLQRPEFTHRMAYTIALPTVAAITGGMLNYAMTGKPPQELKDYFFPRTGSTDENGRPSRVSLPTYIKDVAGFSEHPGKTLTDKLHPMFSTVADMLNNRDYYGVEIRNADDGFMKQAMDVAKFAGKQMIPFGIRGAQQATARGESNLKKAGAFVGITPAPSYLDQTKAEKLATALNNAGRDRGTMTKEQNDRFRLKMELSKAAKSGDATWRGRAQQAMKEGKLFKDDLAEIPKMASLQPLERQIFNMDPEDATKVYEAADDKERKVIIARVKGKIVNAKHLTPDRRRELMARVNAAK